MTFRPRFETQGRFSRLFSLLGGLFRNYYKLPDDIDLTCIPIFILSRDLPTALSTLHHQFISAGFSHSQITIIDLGSSSSNIRDLYTTFKNNGSTVVSIANPVYGPWSLWYDEQIRDLLPSIPFVLTDCDISLQNSFNPAILSYSLQLLEKNPLADKISWHLQTDDIDIFNASAVRAHEHWKINRLSLITKLLRTFMLISRDEYFSTSDTTLSLYRSSKHFRSFAIYLSPRYSIRHLPWYRWFRDTSDFVFYQDNKTRGFGQWS